MTGKQMVYEYVEQNREGDHICYISDLSKIKRHYPGWAITKGLPDIFTEIVDAWTERIR
jgi:CDP-paratose 2-epimerase